MEIVVATKNPHKLKEIQQILKGIKVRSSELRVKETGKTFEENAIKKAKAVYKKTGKITIADDSGLAVDCLNGAPGVHSSRFAYPKTCEVQCSKLLRVMRPWKNRRAKFVCVIAIAYPNAKIKTVKGICRGKIIYEMRGKHGFGYDPVFIPNGYKKTFAQMKPSFKNRISHRARALRKLSFALSAK